MDDVTSEFVMVPRDPTEAMYEAAEAVSFDNEDERAMAVNVWNCMLAAAPEAPPPDVGARPIASGEGREAIRREALEEAARIAEAAAQGDKRMEDQYLNSAKHSNTTAGSEVDLETAVGFAKRSSLASAIAKEIRQRAALPTPQSEPQAPPPPASDRDGERDQGCRVPPSGWWCSRERGHSGPCAARPTERPVGAGWSNVPTAEADHSERLDNQELAILGTSISEWAYNHLARGYAVSLSVREMKRILAALSPRPSGLDAETVEACARVAEERAAGFVSAARRSDMSYGRRIEAEAIAAKLRALAQPEASGSERGS